MRCSRSLFAKPQSTIWGDISPIGAELFGPEWFEQHAHNLFKITEASMASWKSGH
jgi:hypothetical protein